MELFILVTHFLLAKLQKQIETSKFLCDFFADAVFVGVHKGVRGWLLLTSECQEIGGFCDILILRSVRGEVGFWRFGVRGICPRKHESIRIQFMPYGYIIGCDTDHIQWIIYRC